MTEDDYSAAEEAEEPLAAGGYRSYEVYQRERVGETTNLVDPRDFLGDGYLADPFTVPGVLRENYRCFRDWAANRFWLTQYDDVTSVFVDDANFESRPMHRSYGSLLTGQDMGMAAPVAQACAELTDAVLPSVLEEVLDGLGSATDRAADLASQFADRIGAGMVQQIVGGGDDSNDLLQFVALVKSGAGWNERDRVAGAAAIGQLRELLAGRDNSGPGLLSTLAELGASPDDVLVTLINMDLDSLPASLSNLWCLLLSNPEQLAVVQAEPRLMKFAYLESLRHSPSVPTADRFARHEVERFGRLIPDGALMHLSAAAANRDPRQFAEPDQFIVGRKDLCQREPRGQYRADGLPAGITFAHGKPSRQPALPKDSARSRYALTRDVAVAASEQLLEQFPAIAPAPGQALDMTCPRLGGPYRCWSIPVLL